MPVVLDGLLPLVDELTTVTLAAEERSFPDRGITYVYADRRELPFPNDTIDTVMSISVLEHVGMDMTIYGVPAAGAPNPSAKISPRSERLPAC